MKRRGPKTAPCGTPLNIYLAIQDTRHQEPLSAFFYLASSQPTTISHHQYHVHPTSKPNAHQKPCQRLSENLSKLHPLDIQSHSLSLFPKTQANLSTQLNSTQLTTPKEEWIIINKRKEAKKLIYIPDS